jgi:hypothetical protein
MKQSYSISTPLLIIFIVLKLTDVIDWSWVWVLSPLWISAVLVLGSFILITFFALLVSLIKSLNEK